MSEVQVDKISPASGADIVTLGDSGDNFKIPSGGTLTIESGGTITNSGTATGMGGVATGSNQVAQVWAIFDGNGSGTIDDYNCSGITDNGTGDYTVGFTSAFADENFCSVTSACDPNHNSSLLIAHSAGVGDDRTTTSEKVLCQYTSGTASDGDDFIAYIAFGDV